MASTKAPRRHIKRPYELATALRDMRRQQGLTQAELAALAGTSRRWVCDAENGKLPLGIRLLCRLVHHLGYQIELVPAPEPDLDLEAHVASLADPALPGL